MTATVSVIDLLSRLRVANVDLWVEGDRLRFSAPRGALADALRSELREHRDEVMKFLRRAAAPSGALPPIVPVDLDAPVPASFPQRRMWFFEQVRPGTSTYHLAAAWRLRGELDPAALERCLAAIVRRHAPLRTRFDLRDDEPVQIVTSAGTDESAVPLGTVDLADLPPARRETEVDRLLAAEHARPFDLTRAPLIRATLLRLGELEHVLALTIHHIVGDMWSAGVIMRELTALYPAGDPADLPPLPIRYADFAAWQRSWDDDVLRPQLDFWTGRLAGAPPFLELPTDRPRPAAATYAGGERGVTLPADLVAGLDELCRRAGVTRFMLLLAAYYTLLSRYSGETDILVGTPVANRTRVEVEELVGFFVNTLVLRADLDGDPTFAELLGRVRDTTLAAYEHQDLPVERLVEELRPRRDPARPPLFQTMFVLQNTPMSPLELPGLTVEALPSRRAATEFDLTMELAERDGELTANMHYNTDIFDADTVERMLGSWQTLLAGVAADPDRPLSALPLLTDAERDRQLVEWNATERAYRPECAHERIARQAASTPDAPAVVFRDRVLSYGELDAAATALAGRLRAMGVPREQPVAVCVERSPEMIVALLGVLKAGAAYLPADTTLPPERLAYMIDDAGVAVVVTTRAQLPRFAGQPVRPLLVAEPAEEAAPAPPGPVPVGPDHLAYVIYTSGSTGKPKGVMVEHRGLTNFLAGMDDVLGDRERGVWLAVTSVSFDIAVLELLWPLTRGWQVVLQGDGDVLPGAGTRSAAASRTLDFSLFYFASGGDGTGSDDRYRLLLDGARFADRNGFSAVWTPERHFDTFGGLYPNPSVAGAALAAITEHVQVRAGSVVLPLHNPIRVAEEWSVVDNLSHGRVGLSVASGWHADDFSLAPDPEVFARRKEAMLDGIGMLRALWRGEKVRVRNGVGREVEVRTFPRPVQAELPIWLTAAGSPDTFRQAGAMGANLLTHLLGQSVAELTDKIAIYRRAWREAGHPGEGCVSLMAHTYVGTGAAETRQAARGPFREYLRSSFGLVRALAPSLGYDGELTDEDVEVLLDFAFEQYYDGSALMGTVDECVAMAERLRGIGVDEVACLIDFGIDPDDVLAGLPLLGRVREAVVPHAPAEDYGVAAQIARHGVTHLQCTPSLATILLADPATRQALAGVDTLVIGGEALPAALATDLVATARTRVVNMYGPTETTIWSTSSPVTDERVTIGRPIANTTIYIVDANLAPQPVGVPGELCIGGDGVARGYLNRPELTAQRFPASPFRAGARLYRTGDRARYLPDGRIEFLGRVDRQVKLGGHRIELGEIESVLRDLPAVRQAAVIVRAAGGEPAHLVAYLVGDDRQPSSAELREWLLPKVPEVMVPAVVVWLDGLPLNSSGKVDYRALPDPGEFDAQRSARASVTRREYVGPRDGVEQTIAGIWQDVLNVDRVGMLDGFFELGGHSLMAIQLVSRLRTALGVDVGLRAVFESATVADLAQRVRAADGDAAAAVLPPLRPAARDVAVPLSFAQQRMWFFDQLNPGITSYHLSATLRLRGDLDPGALHRAFEEIVRRHEILRTNFDVAVDGAMAGEPVQVIVADRPVPLPLVDLTGLAPAEREDIALRLAQQETRRPFDLARDPLLRTTLLRLAAGAHVLLLTTHHIVSDSWSIGVLVRELGTLYEGFLAGRPSPLPELSVQYADFAAWQRDWLDGPVVEKQLAYWQAALDGAPLVMPLPSDRPRPEVPTFRGSQVGFELPREVSDGLKALSQANDVTVFVVLLAAFTTLLRRWAGEEHVVLGVPVAGRDAPELEPLIGFFANAMVLHVDLTGDPTFAEALTRVRDIVVGAYDHQHLPVEKLVADLGVERDLAHNPLFQTMFVYTNDLVMLPALGDVAVEPMDVDQGHVFMDLNLAMEDGPDGLRGTLDYSADLFDPGTVDWLLASFQELLTAVVADVGARISQLPVPPVPAVAEDPVDALPIVVTATFTANPVLESLAFWTDRLDLPVDVEFAPYNQVFQQLLDPASAVAANRDGLNVALLRMADWAAGDAETSGAEFVEALAAFQRDRDTPFVVVFCPPAEADADAFARWRAGIAAGLARVDGVLCLDMAAMLGRYGVADPLDPIGEQAGNIPYTPEFYTALGTCLARQVAALVSEYPEVVVIDGDQWLDEAGARLLGAAATALATQGRQVFVCGDAASLAGPDVIVLPGDRPLAERLDEVALRTGVPASGWLFLSGAEPGCAAARVARPDVVVLEHPRDGNELAGFLEHTWLLDPQGAPTPGVRWWGSGGSEQWEVP